MPEIVVMTEASFREHRRAQVDPWVRMGLLAAPALPVAPFWDFLMASLGIEIVGGAIFLVQIALVAGCAHTVTEWLVAREVRQAHRDRRFQIREVTVPRS